MYSITTTGTGGTIYFNTEEEVRNFLAGAVYGIILQYETNNEGTLPLDAVASIIVENFHMPETEINSRDIADMVKPLL